MATTMNLLGNEIHEVQESWASWKDLKAAHQYAKPSPKDIHFFRVVSPTETPKIMGLKWIHSPKALQQHSRLTFCPWCRKEGQNKGMVVNHLQTMHYHLGLICACCLDYFTTSADAMHWHTQLFKSTAAGDDDDREESQQTMRRMKMVMATTTSPCHLHILSSCGQLHPLHQCPCQGRPFLLKSSGNSNCSLISVVPVLTHYL